MIAAAQAHGVAPVNSQLAWSEALVAVGGLLVFGALLLISNTNERAVPAPMPVEP